MTYEEALEAAKGGLEVYESKYPHLVEQIEFQKIVIKALEKQTPKGTMHPTQKPNALLEWLIKTYSNEGDTVLDNCCGSGSTCVAAKNLGRHYIGFETDENYYNMAMKNISNAGQRQITMWDV